MDCSEGAFPLWRLEVQFEFLDCTDRSTRSVVRHPIWTWNGELAGHHPVATERTAANGLPQRHSIRPPSVGRGALDVIECRFHRPAIRRSRNPLLGKPRHLPPVCAFDRFRRCRFSLDAE